MEETNLYKGMFKEDEYLVDLSNDLVGSDPFKKQRILGHGTQAGEEKLGSQLSKRQIPEKVTAEIMTAFREFSNNTDQWCMWVSETLCADLNLPLPIKSKMVQVFFIAVDCPPILLTISTQDMKHTDCIEDYSSNVAFELKRAIHDYCYVDFLLLTCNLISGFSPDDLRECIKNQRSEQSRYFGGRIDLIKGSFEKIRRSTIALSACISLHHKIKDKAETVYLMERVWRDKLSEDIETLDRTGELKLPPDTCSSDHLGQDLGVLAALEATKRFIRCDTFVTDGKGVTPRVYITGTKNFCSISENNFHDLKSVQIKISENSLMNYITRKDAGDEGKEAWGGNESTSAAMLSGQACPASVRSDGLLRKKADLKDNDPNEIRIMLIGKTGSGKSATGNTILGVPPLDKVPGFEEFCGQSSGTDVCTMRAVDINGQTVRVIDTPGFCDTHRNERETLFEISKCLVFASPGPHVILFIVRSDGRFTQEEMDAYYKLRDMFRSCTQYMCVVFTYGEKLKEGMVTLEKNLDRSRSKADDARAQGRHVADINKILRKVGNRYLLFSNKADQVTKDEQVLKLLEMIRTIKDGNSGPYFTDKNTKAVALKIEQRLGIIMEEKQVNRKMAFKILLEEIDSATVRTWRGGFLGGVASVLTGGAALPLLAGDASIDATSGALSKCSVM